MGCINSDNKNALIKNQCGTCHVGKILLKLKRIDLHSLNLEL